MASKNPPLIAGDLSIGSLAVTYFRTGIRTIIGAAAFHGPVREGKGWYRSAVAAKHKGVNREPKLGNDVYE